MSVPGYSPSDVPTYETGEERVEELQTALNTKEPFIVVGPMSDDYLVAYDMATTGCNLTEVSVADIRDLFDEAWDDYETSLDDPEGDLEELTYDRPGKMNGSLYPIDEHDALEIASSISVVLLDEENWQPATE
jgi:hypothetical protein